MDKQNNSSLREMQDKIEYLEKKLRMLKPDIETDVSIIVYADGSVNTLKYCLDSVINQSFRKLELICLYPGTDKTVIDLLKKYSAADTRIAVYYSEYMDIISNIEFGLKTASGKYAVILSQNSWFSNENSLNDMYQGIVEKETLVCGGIVSKQNSVCEIDDKSKELFLYNEAQNIPYISGFIFKKDYIQEKIKRIPDLSYYYQLALIPVLLNEGGEISFLNKEVAVRAKVNEKTENPYLRAEDYRLPGESIKNVVIDFLKASDYILGYALSNDLDTLYLELCDLLFFVWNITVSEMFSLRNSDVTALIKSIDDKINVEKLLANNVYSVSGMYYCILTETVRKNNVAAIIDEIEAENSSKDIPEDQDVLQDQAASQAQSVPQDQDVSQVQDVWQNQDISQIQSVSQNQLEKENSEEDENNEKGTSTEK